MYTLYLVIPCYNEEEVLKMTSEKLKSKMLYLIKEGKINSSSRIVFVNDGSKDRTWPIIKELHQNNSIFSGINLSRNQGHQNALLAGLMTVKDLCDMAISLDADLQDDINAIDKMIDAYQEGFDIVYGVRDSRETDTFFKRFTAESFYRLMELLGANTVSEHADFRLMSRRAINGLSEFTEVNLFLRGLVPLIGYPSTKVYYTRGKRMAGESKYPLKKMLFFAFEGITSLSVKPIRMITMLGFLIVLVTIGMFFFTLYHHFSGAATSGWSSLMLSLWGLGGLVIFSLGVVGEYIGKIYLETKHRPRYIVEDFLNE